MNKKSTIIILILIVIAIWWWRRSGGDATADGADDKLARHGEAMCKIAGDNIDNPKRGVDRFSLYMARHTGDITKQFGDLLVSIETIKDDAAHDRRAREAGQRIRGPLMACSSTIEEFMNAVAEDPEASAAMAYRVQRLNRTFELLLGADSRELLWLEPFLQE